MIDAFKNILDLGGPVVVLLMGVSVVTVAIALYKLWQFSSSGVGRHTALQDALAAWDRGDRAQARRSLSNSRSYLAPVIEMGIDTDQADTKRLQAEAETRFAQLERGFRFMESVAQLAPLLGLFGTVLGMIEAFRSLQAAGNQVDPSLLAGGIWVALLTTAVGLAVAMPTSMIHSWFEARMDAERVTAERAIAVLRAPQGRETTTPAVAGTMYA